MSGPAPSLESQPAKVQAALLRIAALSGAAEDMQQFYSEVHEILQGLLYAENCYVALYDAETDRINFAYYRDSVDLDIPDPRVWEPMGMGQARGSTAYVLRTGKPQLMTPARHEELEALGEIELVGSLGQDWLGIPLVDDGRPIGVLVVQTYRPEERYSDEDVDLLVYVAQHIATALARTRQNDETRQQAAELAIINRLQRGLAERIDAAAMYDLVGDTLRDVLDPRMRGR